MGIRPGGNRKLLAVKLSISPLRRSSQPSENVQTREMSVRIELVWVRIQKGGLKKFEIPQYSTNLRFYVWNFDVTKQPLRYGVSTRTPTPRPTDRGVEKCCQNEQHTANYIYHIYFKTGRIA